MSEPIDVPSGQMFGRWMILHELDRRPSARRRMGLRVFRCRCECGEVRDVLLTNLRQGYSRSCGCLNDETRRSPETRAQLASIARMASITHGLRHHPLYNTWHNMMQRCYYARAQSYKDYGGRGISVCDDWRDVATFITWIEANLGPRPDRHSLDRIDVNGNYEPGNVRWADARTQALNKRPH